MHPTCLHGRGRSSQDSLCCGSAFAIMDFSPQSHFWGRYPQVASCSSSGFEAPGTPPAANSLAGCADAFLSHFTVPPLRELFPRQRPPRGCFCSCRSRLSCFSHLPPYDNIPYLNNISYKINRADHYGWSILRYRQLYMVLVVLIYALERKTRCQYIQARCQAAHQGTIGTGHGSAC